MWLGILSVLVVVVCGSSSRRLIDFGNGTKQWMDIEDVLTLAARPGIRGGFLDITDHGGPKAPLDWQQHLSDWANHQPIPVNVTRTGRSELRSYVEHLSAYQNRRYDSSYGKEAAEWIHDTFAAIGEGQSGVSVNFYNHNWLQPSVIARVEGTTAATDICILGAHEDSTAPGGVTGRAPGADDDGTGTATVLEVFRQLVGSGWRPARPVEFQTYAAEEVGLRGSADIASDYRSQGKQVRGMLQLDMTSYVGNSGKVVGVITDYTDASLTKQMSDIIVANTDRIPTDTRCGYACSDHASWYNNGFPAAHVFETVVGRSNPDIHTSRDTIEKLDIEGKGEEFVKMALAYVQWCSA